MTVEPVLGEGPGDRHRGLEPVIQEEESAADEKSLRLKGNAHGQLKLQIIIYKHVLYKQKKSLTPVLYKQAPRRVTFRTLNIYTTAAYWVFLSFFLRLGVGMFDLLVAGWIVHMDPGAIILTEHGRWSV